MKSEKELSALLLRSDSTVLKVCRTCLCDTPNGACSLFPKDKNAKTVSPADKLTKWSRVDVQTEDTLPKIICANCLHHLEEAHVFLLKCQEADSLLRKVLAKNVTNVEKLESKHNILKDIKKEQVDIEFCEYVDDDPVDNFDDLKAIDVLRQNNVDVQIQKSLKEANKEFDAIIEPKKEEKVETNNDDADAGTEKKKQRKVKKVKKDKEKDKHVCEHCSKSLKNKYILIKHLRVIHGVEAGGRKKKPDIGPVTGKGAQKRYHCPECDYSSPRRQTLQFHMYTHTGERPYKCDECPRSFTQHTSLTTHKKTHSDKTYYQCQECGREFKHYDIFKNHRQVHSKELKFPCNICNKRMKTQRSLTEHMNRHLQILQYSCEYCGRSFVTRSCLALHIKYSHSKNKEKKHQCTLCERKFYTKSSMEVHIKRHTNTRNFSCEYCSHMCYTNGELKAHIRKHTKERNFQCPLCEMKFRHSPSLNKHMLKKHDEKYKYSSTIDRRMIK